MFVTYTAKEARDRLLNHPRTNSWNQGQVVSEATDLGEDSVDALFEVLKIWKPSSVAGWTEDRKSFRTEKPGRNPNRRYISGTKQAS